MGIFDDRNERHAGIVVCGAVLACATFVTVFVFITVRIIPWYVPAVLFGSTLVATLVTRWIPHPRLMAFQHGIVLFGTWINYVVIWMALFIVYVVGIGLVAVVARLAGKKFLEMKNDHTAKSWWESLNLSTESRERYFDLF